MLIIHFFPKNIKKNEYNCLIRFFTIIKKVGEICQKNKNVKQHTSEPPIF